MMIAQFIMGALFNNPIFIQDNYLVGMIIVFNL